MGIQEVSEITEISFSGINAMTAHNFALDLWVLEIVVTEVQPSLCLQTQETKKTKDVFENLFLPMYYSGDVDGSDDLFISA